MFYVPIEPAEENHMNTHLDPAKFQVLILDDHFPNGEYHDDEAGEWVIEYDGEWQINVNGHGHAAAYIAERLGVPVDSIEWVSIDMAVSPGDAPEYAVDAWDITITDTNQDATEDETDAEETDTDTDVVLRKIHEMRQAVALAEVAVTRIIGAKDEIDDGNLFFGPIDVKDIYDIDVDVVEILRRLRSIERATRCIAADITGENPEQTL
jgi:hypothetical protein